MNNFAIKAIINEVSLSCYLVFYFSPTPKNAETPLRSLEIPNYETILKFMTDTSQLWYSLNKDCSDIPKTPVESYSDSKEQTNKFSDDIKALGEYFPQLASLLATNKNEQGLILEISLKEIFVLCPRNRCRVDRYSQLQEYLNKNYNVTLIIKSQKTKPNDHEKDNL